MEGLNGNLFFIDKKMYIVFEKYIIIVYYYYYIYVYNVYIYDVIDSDGIKCGVNVFFFD